MIEVHLLRYALAAADSGSFSRAAEQFRVKQSTLSRQIRYLEQRLGISLFTRSTQGVAPTPGGRQFLARARSIVGDLEQLSAESAALANGSRGTLRIGFTASLLGGDLRAILDECRRAFPEVTIDAVEAGRDTLIDALDRGRLDMIATAGGAAEPRRSLALWSEPLVLGLPDGHSLLDRERLYWTDLIGGRFMVTSADPGKLIAAIIAARLTGPSHRPEIVAQSVSRENLHSLASHDCWTVTAGTAPPNPGISYRPVHDAFGPTRLDQCLCWREENANPALGRFLGLVGRRYGRTL